MATNITLSTPDDLDLYFAIEPAPISALSFPVRHYQYNDVEPVTEEMVEERLTAAGEPLEIDHILELANFEPDYFDDKSYFDIADFLNTH